MKHNTITFASYLKSKGYSHKTIQSYENQLKDYKEWVKSEALDIKYIHQRELLDYIKDCRKRGNTQRTIRNKIGVLHHYYQYLKIHYIEIIDPTTGITIQGVKGSSLYIILEPHQLHQLYEQYPIATP